MHLDILDKKSIFIAIAGITGSGKTTISNILIQLGYSVIDTDKLSKDILAEDATIIKHLELIVGESVSYDGKIDFKRVSKIFDDNPEMEKRFEEWYQVVLGKRIIEKKIALCNENKIIFFDIPMLIQKGIADQFDFVWIVDSREADCYERIKKRNNYSDIKIKYLIENSRTNGCLLTPKCKIIENNNSIEELKMLITSNISTLEFELNLT